MDDVSECGVVRAAGGPEGYRTYIMNSETKYKCKKLKINSPIPLIRPNRWSGPDRGRGRRCRDSTADRKIRHISQQCRIQGTNSRLIYEEMGKTDPTRKPAGSSPISTPWKGYDRRRGRSGQGWARPANTKGWAPSAALPPPIAILFP